MASAIFLKLWINIVLYSCAFFKELDASTFLLSENLELYLILSIYLCLKKLTRSLFSLQTTVVYLKFVHGIVF